MKNICIITCSVFIFFICSCSNRAKGFGSNGLGSVTTIMAQTSFVLGNNPHAPFSVNLKNISPNAVSVSQKPLAGVAQSETVVKPNQSVRLNVPSNTAVLIANKSNEKVDVALEIVGDTNLSMGYKN
jgi:hypothetical protein